MIDPVQFIIRPSGRIEAMLGNHLVGIIEEWPTGNRRGLLGTVNAHYRITLPVDGATPVSPRGATSIKAARRQLLQWLAGWFEAAGLHFAPICEAIVSQALEERDA